ncbi:TetR/AcrR family transcriptional regulator [Nocardioides panzhihuensis]|uniref:AcrR family transcriptional regulator n=1 Tax=Nocardioides panzhihuensis TaxID=860243 RepID=A0A7Z0IQ84_9ACTN|nr:TetR/AcrR family transcriptional regulator [Nocardioides panzhihuensis]NYI75528.1 AcrR family transcriptional regulator [Nocardioides panzhihuensis]
MASTPAPTKRRHSAGEATRVLLIEVAERLFATRGLEGVTIAQIQLAAGQSNSSVIGYHFGSRDGLIQAILEHRQPGLAAQRERLLAELLPEGGELDVRGAVWLMVRPFATSIREGEMFVPLLARLSDDPDQRQRLGKAGPSGISSLDGVEQYVESALSDLPDRVRRGRVFMLYNSVLNLLGERARSFHDVTEAQLEIYVDGWVGLLEAPVSSID